MTIRKLLLIKIFVFYCVILNGQTLGLKASPNITLDELNEKYLFGISNGVCYDHEIFKQIIISTGFDYTIQRSIPYSVIHTMDVSQYPYPDKTEIIYNIIEFPLGIALTPSTKQTAKWKFYFTIGYSLGYTVRAKIIDFFPDHKSIYYSNWNIKYKENLTIGKFGFEIRHNMNDKINIAFGSYYKHFYYFDNRDDKLDNINVFIKVGIILNFKKLTSDNKQSSEEQNIDN